MLFERRLREGIADGTVTVMFRRWRRVQAVAGHRYRTGGPMILVTAVTRIDPAQITAADASKAGYPSVCALVADLRGSEEAPLYRVEFVRVNEPDPRDILAADDCLTAEEIAAVDQRLTRWDRTGAPWTAATLAAIADRPGVRAADLAASLGRDTASFKLDVRKLKALGLTQSLPVGYQLSPRGAAYLRQLVTDQDPG